MKPNAREKLLKGTKKKKLQITNSRLKYIPTQLEEFTELIHLDLFGNNITMIPDWFYKLNKLEHVSFNTNKFVDIPTILFTLPNLNYLSFRENKIIEIKVDDTENLFKIRKIDISYNNLQSLPNIRLNYSYTKILSFEGNNLIEFPSILKNMSTLIDLNLSNNKIEKFDDDIFEYLNNIESLDLSNNHITYLPSSIGKLNKLKHLNLSGNNISYLPKEFENLTSLLKLELSGNPVDEVPVEIKAQGTQGIINYYLSLGDNVKLFEAKLLIVGQGNVGKTFLMNRIIHNQTPQTSTTEGIEINTWKVKTKISDEFRINVWDFGGQEIYHATHQFFLTKRSLYVLVWEARTDHHVMGFDYWLNVIKLLSNDSPTIIVLNKIDERIISIDEASLKDKFNNIVSFHKVSAIEGTNIENLANEISNRIGNLPLIGDKLPRVWVEIREELENINNNYITLEKYLKICNKHGLSNKKALFLSQYFHDLGVFLHFQDNHLLRQLVFLKPEWATNAVYKILDSKLVIKNLGEFSIEDLDSILKEYTSNKQPYIIELMKKFELCFPIENNNFLIPELLNPEKPELDWDYSQNLKFEYNYDFMPAGILTRFIVRMRQMIYNKFLWKNGVILERENTLALVTSDNFSRKVQIWIRGSNRAALLEIMRNEIEIIHKSLNYNSVPEKIPCNCPTCSMSLKPHLFNYQFAKRAGVENKFKSLRCEISFSGVNLHNLLGLYQVAANKKEPELQYDLDSLLHDLIKICSFLLERKFQDKNENILNDKITDFLRNKDYIVSDQTRSGISAGGIDAGSLDMMIRKADGTPFSIIECFRLSSCGTDNIIVAEHIHKLLNNYDTHGLSRKFVIVYSEAKRFTRLWDNYVHYLNNLNNNNLFEDGYLFSGFSRKEELSNYEKMKIGIARHEKDGHKVEIVHIVLDIT